MKARTIFDAIAVAIMAGVSIFAACSKDENKGSIFSTNKNLPSNIPHYADDDAINQVINTALSFDSLSELIEYENTQGRQSIGAISELFLENIDTNAFADAAAALDFCCQNSHLIDITVSDLDTSVNPKWFNTPYRYAANSDGYFAVGDYVFRLFDEGIVMVSAENYTDLLNLDEQTNFRDLDESTYLFQPYFYAGTSSDPHGSCPFGTYFSNTKNLRQRQGESGFENFSIWFYGFWLYN